MPLQERTGAIRQAGVMADLNEAPRLSECAFRTLVKAASRPDILFSCLTAIDRQHDGALVQKTGGFVHRLAEYLANLPEQPLYLPGQRVLLCQAGPGPDRKWRTELLDLLSGLMESPELRDFMGKARENALKKARQEARAALQKDWMEEQALRQAQAAKIRASARIGSIWPTSLTTPEPATVLSPGRPAPR
ncbi:MAG: hypothetical protein M3O22_08420 [Pseudomonadota bacterium]|nr:hypothetical protein [Pseudomonadota bacterium]